MATKDPYKTLGVDKKASAEEIKKAYRKLARQYHPDRNPDDPKSEERFKEIQHAYDIVGDADKRKEYDRGGLFGSGGGGGGGFGGAAGGAAGGFADILSDLFGAGRTGPGGTSGRGTGERAPSAAATSRPRSPSRSTRPWTARRSSCRSPHTRGATPAVARARSPARRRRSARRARAAASSRRVRASSASASRARAAAGPAPSSSHRARRALARDAPAQ